MINSEQGTVTLFVDTYSAMQAVVTAAREVLNCVDESDTVWNHFSGGGCLDLLEKAVRAYEARTDP